MEDKDLLKEYGKGIKWLIIGYTILNAVVVTALLGCVISRFFA